ERRATPRLGARRPAPQEEADTLGSARRPPKQRETSLEFSQTDISQAERRGDPGEVDDELPVASFNRRLQYLYCLQIILLQYRQAAGPDPPPDEIFVLALVFHLCHEPQC